MSETTRKKCAPLPRLPHRQAKDWSAAALAYEAAISKDDSNAVLHFRLGFAREMLSNREGAAAAYAAAIARDDRFAKWHFRLGLVRASLKSWPEAAASFEAALARDHTTARWHFLLGLARAKAGDWSGAAVAYEAAVALDDSHADWHFRLATMRARVGDWSGAASAYEAALALDDTKAQWHFNLAVLRSKLRDWAGAAAAYAAAVARDDINADWHFRLATMRARIGDWSAAVAAYEAAVAHDNSRGAWHGCLGRARIKVKDVQGAIEAFQAAIARDDADAHWHCWLGIAQGWAGDWGAAARAYEAAAVRDPRNAELQFKAGNARAMNEDWDGAVEAYRTALTLDPNKDQSRYRLGLCLARRGEEAEAHTILAPLVIKGDTFLESSSPSVGYSTERKTLFVHSLNTVLARRVVSNGHSGHEVFFEHLKVGSRCKRTSDFYASLGVSFGNSMPDFVPRLHYETSDGQYWYFLYEYLDIASNLPLALGTPGDHFDLQLAKKAVACLIQISTRFQDVFDSKDAALSSLAYTVRYCDVERSLRKEVHKNQRDFEYSQLLLNVSKLWSNHYSRFQKVPQVPCHGDAHGGNFVLSGDGGLSVIDWECYGWAPICLDLVWLFIDRLECPEFEQLLDPYFDGVSAAVAHDERRFIVAMLATFAAIARNRPLPRKWLRYLA